MSDNRWWSRGLTVHAVVVAVPVVAFAALVLSYDGIGANIGAGLVLLVVLALGLPFSLPVLLDPSVLDAAPGPLRYAANLAPAFLVLGAHVLLRRWRRSRRSRV